MKWPDCFLLVACVLAASCTPSLNNTPPPGDLGARDGAATLDGSDGGVSPGDAADGGGPRIACTDDTPCAPNGQRCYRPLGYCVQCATDGECAAGVQVCTQGRCVDRVSCTTSRQCPGQVCDLARGVCADCSTDPDCPTGSVCRFNNCVAPPLACRSSRECGPLDQVCDTGRGVCVDCLADPDCPTGNYCASSTCIPQACMPGAVECVGANRVRRCDSRGTLWSESACPTSNTCVEGVCMSRLCAPDARSCADASNRRVCNADGLAYTTTACGAGESCDRGDCLPRSCTPGAAVCSDGLTRRVCNADGLGFAVAPCPGGQGCVAGTCTPFLCSPGSASCADASTRRACDPDGQSFTNAACATMQSCSGGACVPWRCTPGAVTCSGGAVSTCNSDGLNATAVACGTNETCTAGRCAPRTCSPGTLYCDAMGNRQLCSGDGASSTPAPCEAGLACSGGTCRARGDACPGIDLTPDGPTTTVIPTGLSNSADLGTTCGSGSSRTGWTDVVFHLPLAAPRDVVLTVNTGLANTRVQLQATCAAGQTAIGACLSGGNPTRRYRNLAAGDYTVVVEIYGPTGPIQIGVTTTAPNLRAPGDTCPGVDVATDTTATSIATATFDNVSDLGTSCGSAAAGRDGYTDWVAHFALSTTRDVTLTAAPSSLSSGGRYELRSGCGVTSTPIGACYTGSSLNRRYRALPPGDYYLVGEQVSGSPGNVAVTVATSSPDNRVTGDACSTAALVVPDGSAVSISPSGLDYVSDVGTPCGSMRPRTDNWYDVLWRFSLTSARDVQLNFTNLPSGARWQVYQGCGATPQGVCNNTSTASTFVRGLAAGDYFVVLETQSGFSSFSQPSLRLTTVVPGARLTGDACVNPREVTVDGGSTATSIAGFDVGADVGTACSTSGSHAGFGDGVWHFRTTSPRDVTLSFSGAPSSFYWQLQRTCATNGGLVAGCQGSSGSGTRRYRDLPAGDYYVIGEWAGALTNSITLTATSTATTTRAAGDTCANPVTVTPDGAAASVAVDGLALGGDDSTRCGSGTNATASFRDAVFRYTLTSTRDVTINVAYASTAYFEVWSTCGDSATAVLTCTATSGGSGRLMIPRQAAGTYFIVAQTTSTAGPLAVTVNTTPPGTTSGYSLGLSPTDVNYTDVCSLAGAISVLPSLDDGSVIARLPFNFRFWGTTLPTNSSVGVSSNGFISMDGIGSASYSPALPGAGAPNGVIAAGWYDLSTGPTGVCYATLGSAPTRRWVVQWSGARFLNSSSPVNMEIILNESTNLIDLVYGTAMTSGGTIGVENLTGTTAVTYPSTMPLSNVRLRFTPN